MQRQVELERILQPAVQALGYQLWDLEVRLGRGRSLLRMFIDRDEGIGLEDCERVSRQVSAVLDVEDPIPGDYQLEVSSPGLDRRLSKPEHFGRFKGHEIKLRLRRALDGRRRFHAELLDCVDGDVIFAADGQKLSVSLTDIEMARLVPDLDTHAQQRGPGQPG